MIEREDPDRTPRTRGARPEKVRRPLLTGLPQREHFVLRLLLHTLLRLTHHLQLHGSLRSSDPESTDAPCGRLMAEGSAGDVGGHEENAHSPEISGPSVSVFSNCDRANSNRAVRWRRNRSSETTRTGGNLMRVAPSRGGSAFRAEGSQLRELRGPRNAPEGGQERPQVRNLPASSDAGS